jgi:ribosomal protein S18 acetylase RimI-like enzyme
MNTTRRQATSQDMGLLFDLNKQAMKEHIVENFGEWIESEQFRIFKETTDVDAHDILMIDEQPIGFINVFHSDRELHINRLCIIPAFQSRGIGTAILNELIASNPPMRPIRLQVFPNNPAARLYRRLGFREIKVTITHLHMVYSTCSERS